VVMEEREAIPILSWFVVRGAFVMTREGARGAQEALVVRKRRSGCARGARGAQEALVVRKRRSGCARGARGAQEALVGVVHGSVVTGRALSKAGEREEVSSSLHAKGGGSQDRRTANSASRRTESRLFLVAREHGIAAASAIASRVNVAPVAAAVGAETRSGDIGLVRGLVVRLVLRESGEDRVLGFGKVAARFRIAGRRGATECRLLFLRNPWGSLITEIMRRPDCYRPLRQVTTGYKVSPASPAVPRVPHGPH
jgi:hypothetical protein